MTIYLAADHAGFELKSNLVDFLQKLGYDVLDCGAYTYKKDDDYPRILKKAAILLLEDVKNHVESYAIVIGGSAQGEAVAMNRFRGIRCGVLYAPDMQLKTDSSGRDLSVVESMKVHDNTNALALASRALNVEDAQTAVSRWLRSNFTHEERHVRRIKQIDDLPLS